MVYSDRRAAPQDLAGRRLNAAKRCDMLWRQRIRAGDHVDVVLAHCDWGGEITRQTRVLPHPLYGWLTIFRFQFQTDAAVHDRAGDYEVARPQRRDGALEKLVHHWKVPVNRAVSGI